MEIRKYSLQLYHETVFDTVNFQSSTLIGNIDDYVLALSDSEVANLISLIGLNSTTTLGNLNTFILNDTYYELDSIVPFGTYGSYMVNTCLERARDNRYNNGVPLFSGYNRLVYETLDLSYGDAYYITAEDVDHYTRYRRSANGSFFNFNTNRNKETNEAVYTAGVPYNTQVGNVYVYNYPSSHSYGSYVAYIYNLDSDIWYSLTYTWGQSNSDSLTVRLLQQAGVNLENLWYRILDYQVVDLNNPYAQAGETGIGGGTGDFDGTSDDIDIPDLPTISALNTFFTLFVPTTAQLQSLASFLWSSLLSSSWQETLDALKKIVSNPMDAMFGMGIVPVSPTIAGSKDVSIYSLDSGVNMNYAGTQYVAVDCGTLNVNEYWGAYLDYSPYSKVYISLPYIGTQQLNIDDVMGKAVHVVYHIDLLSGACVAYVKCGASVLYQFIGNCMTNVPITANDWTSTFSAMVNIASSIGGAIATGGASAIGTAAAQGVLSTAANAGSLKPNVQKSGSMSSSAGMLGIQTPYLILERPRQAIPASQNKYTGYPSFITGTVGSVTGFTQWENVDLDGVPATDAEKQEIESLLKSGVIL